MPRIERRLTASAFESLRSAGLHRVDSGLYVLVDESGTKRTWFFRYTAPGTKTPRKMGLGSVARAGETGGVTFLGAIAEAGRLRSLVAAGVDPIEQRRALEDDERRERAERREAEVAAKIADEARRSRTFRVVAEGFITAHAPSWKNAKHGDQWRNTLATYAFPTIGDMPVDEITTDDVVEVLAPIWSTKSETAGRLRGRIESILQSVLPDDKANPASAARIVGKKRLPALSHVKVVKHFEALPIDDLPRFMAALAMRPALAARALEFVVLTACRTESVLAATWDEIDFAEAVWTIPAHKMKGRKAATRDHVVPLTPSAIATLNAAKLFRRDGLPWVFPGERGDGHLSNMAMLNLLKRMGVDVTVHGFRSTFRDWTAERTNHQHEVAEAALAHVVANKVEAAYRRGTMFDKRRALMADWETFATSFVGPVPGVSKSIDTTMRAREGTIRTVQGKARLARLEAERNGTAKRGRGRPRKNPIVDPLDTTPSVKRPRGRPKKVVEVDPLD